MDVGRCQYQVWEEKIFNNYSGVLSALKNRGVAYGCKIVNRIRVDPWFIRIHTAVGNHFLGFRYKSVSVFRSDGDSMC